MTITPETRASKTAFECYVDLAGAVIRRAIVERDIEFLRTTGRQWARILESDMEAYDQKVNDIECALYRRRIERHLRMASKSSR